MFDAVSLKFTGRRAQLIGMVALAALLVGCERSSAVSEGASAAAELSTVAWHDDTIPVNSVTAVPDADGHDAPLRQTQETIQQLLDQIQIERSQPRR
jgi:hypothetical protein